MNEPTARELPREIKDSSSILCIYHANCNDGFGAAWCVKQYNSEASFFPAQYGQDPPDVAGRHVIIVDFSYKRPVMERIARDALSVTVLDHHATAESELRPLFESGVISGQFDMSRSGAMMTWDWFFKGRRRPRLLEYIQDRDLWAKSLPKTDEISAWLYSQPYDFDVWNVVVETFDSRFGEYVREGEALLRAQRKRVELALSHAFALHINGQRIPVTHSTDSFSEIARRLAEDAPYGACFFLANKGEDVVFSLRSSPDGADVSKVAAQFGGGGHKHAAGFKMPINQFALHISKDKETQ